MKKDCRLCGNGKDLCKNCQHLLKYADEETIIRMHQDKKTNKVWQENKGFAEELARAYYDYVLEESSPLMKKDSRENFGFNMFCDGIRLGLDVIMPLLDEKGRIIAKEKINNMVRIRNADRH